ncbi:hypothetical protein HN51_016273 [Arachis hypogaea]
MASLLRLSSVACASLASISARVMLPVYVVSLAPLPPRRRHCYPKQKTDVLCDYVACKQHYNQFVRLKKFQWLLSLLLQIIRDVSVDRIIYFSDLAYIENTRMDRCVFHALCNMLKRVGRLEPSRNIGVEEMVAMFLHIIAHDVKIRVIKRQFVRSEETISRRFNDILLAILRCHNLLLKKPQPFSQDRMDE